MDLPFTYRVLVAEEFCLINYELKLMLRKSGFHVIEDLNTDAGSPDFIITCLSELKKTKGQENIINSLLLNNPLSDSTDTIVFDANMKPLVRYPKPFNSNDIIVFILNHLNLNDHENNN